MELKSKKIEVFNLVVAILSICIAFFVIPFHESWRDEAQAWLIARDTTLVSLFQILKYEGHPALWYLILKPFAKLGFPYEGIKYISWFFVSCAIILFQRKAPFKWYFKAIVCLSPVFAYWFPVISRSYSLIVLLVFILAYLYRERKEKPILYGLCIALLVNTHILMAGFSGALLLIELIYIILDLKNKNKVSKSRFTGFAIGFVGCLLMVIQMWGSLEQNGVVKIEESQNNLLYKFVSNCITTGIHLFNSPNIYFAVFTFLVLICFLVGIFVMLLKYPKQELVFACGVGFNLLIIIFLFMPTGQKSHLIILMLLFISWILKVDTENVVIAENDKNIPINKAVDILIAIIILLGFYTGYKNLIVDDIKNEFSTSKTIGQYLNENVGNDDVIVFFDDMQGTSVSPYLEDKAVWNVYNDVYCDYAILNVQRAYRMYDLDNYMEEMTVNKTEDDVNVSYKNSVFKYIHDYMSKHFEQGKNVYIVVNYIYCERFDMEAQAVFETNKCNHYSYSEKYKVYKIVV